MTDELEERVRQILIDHWDPIGLEGYPRDEYDAYGRVIRSKIINGRERTARDFTDYLSGVAEDMMGLHPDVDRIRRTADELVTVRREVRST